MATITTTCDPLMKDELLELIWRSGITYIMRLLDSDGVEITDAGYTPPVVTFGTSMVGSFSGGSAATLLAINFGTAISAGTAMKLRFDRGATQSPAVSPKGITTDIPGGLSFIPGGAISILAGYLTLGEVPAVVTI